MKPEDDKKSPWWIDVPRLWQRDIKSAMRVRWDSGRIGHGRKETDPFIGDPLEEMYEELIDALNYAKEMPFEEGDWQRLWNLTEKIRQQLCHRDREKVEDQVPSYLTAEEQRVGFEPYQSEEEFLAGPPDGENPWLKTGTWRTGNEYMSVPSHTRPISTEATGPLIPPNQSTYDELVKLREHSLTHQMSDHLLLTRLCDLLLQTWWPGGRP